MTSLIAPGDRDGEGETSCLEYLWGPIGDSGGEEAGLESLVGHLDLWGGLGLQP